MPRIGTDPGKKQGAPKPRRRKAASSRPLVLAPGAKWDPKTRRASAPKRKPSPVFRRGLPQPGAQIKAETRKATQRSGRAVANTPGVRRELRPTRRPTSQRERADLIRSTREAIRRTGLTPGQVQALAQTQTPAGLRLRQGQRAQQGGFVRATRETATQGLLRNAGAKPLSPKQLRHARFDKLDPKVKREIDSVAREIRKTGNRAVAKPGRDRDVTHLGPASIDLTVLRHAATALGERATSGHGRAAADAGGQVLRRTVKDAADFPTQAVKGLYEIGAAGVEGAQGRTDRAKKLAGAMTHGFLGELILHGNPKGALKYAAEHPLYAGLDLLGAYGAAGRGAGMVARSGALGKRARRLANTARHDLTIVPGTNIKRSRSYSKNAITMAFQKRGERRARARGEDPNVVTVRRSNRAVNRAINSEADVFNAFGENARRHARDLEARSFDRHGVPTRRGNAAGGKWDRAVAAVDRSLGAPKVTVRGKVRTRRAEQFLISFLTENRVDFRDVRGSLGAIGKRLERVYQAEKDMMSDGARAMNREQVAAIRAVLESPKALANVERAVASSRYVSRRSRKHAADLIRQKALTRTQDRHARERPFAVEQMGAKHNPDAMPYEEAVTRHADLKAAEGRVRATAAAARKEHRSARLDLARLGEAVGVPKGSREARAAVAHILAAPTRAQRVQRYVAAIERLPADQRAVVARLARKDEALARVRTARSARTAAERDLAAATRARRAATPKKYAGGLQIGGRRITLDEITAERKARGLPEPGFLTHRRDSRGARSYFINWFDTRRTPDTHTRTGEATRLGANDVSLGAVRDSLVRQRGLVSAIDTFDRFIEHVSTKRPNPDGIPGGSRWTWDEAVKQADNLSRESGVTWVPLRMGPGRYGDDVLNELERIQNGGELQRVKRAGKLPNDEQVLADAASSALDRMMSAPPAGTKTRNVVLVPEQAIERYSQHQLLGTSAGGQAMQKLTSVFRGTVLSLSTKWLFGNVAEATLRAIFNGVTPRDVFVGRRLMAELRAVDEAAAERLFVQTQQGLLFGGSQRLNVHRDMNGAWRGTGSVMEIPAAGIGAIARAPGMRHLLAGIDGYQRLVFGVNKSMERAFQQGVIGKQARHDIQELTGSWLEATRASNAALRDVARGLTGTPAQVKYARKIDDVLGKYTRFSPETRRLTQSIAPFLPWYLNSLRFVYWTLPRHHPVKTALLANVVGVMNQDFHESTKDAPRGDLQAAIRTKDGGYVTAARYTPFGAFTSGLEGVLDPFYPQLSSLAKIALGYNFTNRKLELSDGEKNPDGARRFFMALNAFAESIVPGLAIARRVREQGRTAFDNSSFFSPKTKPGSAHSSPLDLPLGKAGNRIINPLRPIYLRNPTPKAGSVKLSPAEQSLIRQAEAYQRQTGGGSEAELESLRRQAEAYARMAK